MWSVSRYGLRLVTLTCRRAAAWASKSTSRGCDAASKRGWSRRLFFLLVIVVLVVMLVFVALPGLFELAVDEFGQVVEGIRDLARRDAFFLGCFGAFGSPLLRGRILALQGVALLGDFLRN